MKVSGECVIPLILFHGNKDWNGGPVLHYGYNSEFYSVKKIHPQDEKVAYPHREASACLGSFFL